MSSFKFLIVKTISIILTIILTPIFIIVSIPIIIGCLTITIGCLIINIIANICCLIYNFFKEKRTSLDKKSAVSLVIIFEPLLILIFCIIFNCIF